jgi:hypothetical protein
MLGGTDTMSGYRTLSNVKPDGMLLTTKH